MKYIALILSLLNINLFFMIVTEVIKLDKKFMRVTLENKKVFIFYIKKRTICLMLKKTKN